MFVESENPMANVGGLAVALGDVDGDGDLDAFVGRSGEDPANESVIWLNDGRGQFARSTQRFSSDYTDFVGLQDVDDDGDLDIMEGNLVWLNDGGGGFVRSSVLGNGSDGAVAWGDVNGDGDVDALLRYGEIWVNDGAGKFRQDEATRLGGGVFELADLDADGDLDAYAANRWAPGGGAVWFNDGNGGFHDTGQRLGNSNSSAVALGDVDGDGDLDAFVANNFRQHNQVWLNSRQEEFADLAIAIEDDVTTVAPGEVLRTTILVTNKSKQEVVGASVTAEFSPLLTDVRWACAALTGSTCTARGNGNIQEFVNLGAGGTVAFIVAGKVNPEASESTTNLVTSATVRAPVGILDSLVEDNTAYDTNRLLRPSAPPAGSPGFAFFAPGPVPRERICCGTEPEMTAVALADVNNDDRTDIIVGDRQSQKVLVSFGTEKGTFEPTPEEWFDQKMGYEAGRIPGYLTTGDLNNDGYVDVVVTSSSSWGPDPFSNESGDTVTGISILFGSGSDAAGWLGFAEPVIRETMGDPSASLLHDLDGDGTLELIVPTTTAVFVHTGNGDGTFQEPVRYTSGHGRRTVVTGDLDADGDLDLIVGRENSNTLSVLLAEGDGTFEEQATSVRLDQATWSLATGDLDADGDLDLAIAHNYFSYDNNLTVLMGKGDGTFEDRRATYTVAGRPLSIAIGDVDTDGDLDLAVADAGGFHHPRYDNFGGGLSVLLGQGDGTFDTPVHVGGESWGVTSVVLSDLNVDGNLDILRDDAQAGFSLLLARRDTIFQDRLDRYEVVEYYHAPLATDLNADGHTDVVVGGDQSVIAFTNSGHRTFDVQRYMLESWPQSILARDVNNDGRLDLLTRTHRNVAVLLAQEDGAFAAPSLTTSADPSYGLMYADHLNGDGYVDLLTDTSGNLTVLLGVGDGKFRSPMTQRVDGTLTSLVTADFDADGNIDLAMATHKSEFQNHLQVFLGSGTGSFVKEESYHLDGWIWKPSAVDLNDDGHMDLVAVIDQASSNSIVVLLGQGNGTFSDPVQYPLAGFHRSMRFEDLEQDGDLDLLVTGDYWIFEDSAYLSVLLGNGDGTFADRHDYVVAATPRSVALEDFDRDGVLDIAVASRQHVWGGVSLLRGRGDGTFGPATVQDFPKRGFDFVSATDMDGDSDLDLLLVGPDGLAVLENLTRAAVQDRLGDYDQDGDVDEDDASVWRQSFGRVVVPGTGADGNSDGIVDAADFTIWRNSRRSG